jgi:hypothetical protein
MTNHLSRCVMLALALTAGAIGTQLAAAISRVGSMSHSCAQLRQIIASQGAVIITHPGSRASGTLYDRYVSDSGYCDPGEVATSDWVPAKDGSCRMYNCQDFEPLFDDR